MSSRDVLFLEESFLGPVLTQAVLHIHDEVKRKRASNFRKVAGLLSQLGFLPLDRSKVVGIAYGHDTLGVPGIFVILDKTTVQGAVVTPDGHKVHHEFTPHILDPNHCARCAFAKLDIIHEPRHKTYAHEFSFDPANKDHCIECGQHKVSAIHLEKA